MTGKNRNSPKLAKISRMKYTLSDILGIRERDLVGGIFRSYETIECVLNPLERAYGGLWNYIEV